MSESAQRCVAAGTYTTELEDPAPEEIAAALAALNAEALAAARALADAALVHITNTPTDGVIGEAYSFQLTADGGTGPYTFSLLEGALPGGITLSASGLLSGTAVSDEDFYMSIFDAYVWRVKIRAVGDTDDACYTAFALRFDAP